MTYVLRGTHPTDSNLDFQEQHSSKLDAKIAIGAKLASLDGWYTQYMTLHEVVENPIIIGNVLALP